MARILIADDMKVVSKMFKEILELNGHNVVGMVDNCSDAISEYKKYQPDLLLLDLMGMNSFCKEENREINSFDVISKLVKELDAKIIVITASNNENLIKQCLLSGVKNYIIKGESNDIFLEKIKNVLQHQ